MPIYEFQCQQCEHVWEDWFSSFNALEIPEQCPECNAKNQVVKIPSVCSGSVKLEGQALKEHIKSEKVKIKREVATNENLKANIVGESKYNEILNNTKKINDKYNI